MGRVWANWNIFNGGLINPSCKFFFTFNNSSSLNISQIPYLFLYNAHFFIQIFFYHPRCVLYTIILKSVYSETCLNQTLSKPKTCLIQTDFTVSSTKYLCHLNLCKSNTCLNRTNSSVPKGFSLDRFYCIILNLKLKIRVVCYMNVYYTQCSNFHSN